MTFFCAVELTIQRERGEAKLKRVRTLVLASDNLVQRDFSIPEVA